MKPDWTNARSADGPTLVRYVSEWHGVSSADRDDPFAVTVHSWDRADRLVNIYTVDRWFTPRGIFLCDLPEDCWRWSTSRCPVRLRPLCEKIAGEYAEGKHDANYYARAYGIQHRVAHRWLDGLDLA